MFDPFGALGLERRFDLDDAAIEAAFLQRLAMAHPDLAGESSSADAAGLTDARGLLLDPERRASTLLALMGGAVASDHKALPDGFLMEMMELRGEIESDLAEGGSESRCRWEAFAEERRASHIAKSGALFSQLGGVPNESDLRAIRIELNAWRYTERLIEQLDPGYDPARADFD